MAESFVNTFKRDYAACMGLKDDARTVLAQLPAAHEHYNQPGASAFGAKDDVGCGVQGQQTEEGQRREAPHCG